MPKPGTLLKLTMTNFQTFKHATFTFSPYLNFIAAPNGSGKSTITNAINFLCLGTPTTLSKNMALKDFIKFGQTTATIEGFFYGEAKRKPSIRDFTSFNSQNKNFENMTSIKRVFTINESHFYIDGEKAKKIDVSNLLNSWNINVMNMTQFLPQDRVSEFAKMNSEELFKQVLKSTNISICENEIIELENIIKEKNKDLEAFNNKRKGTNSIVNNLKEDVDRTREAMQKQMKMKLIKFKILSIEYGNLLKDCRHINNEKKK
ncbi:Structural maintenance of chromosomes protein 5 [Gurleya vavrai]